MDAFILFFSHLVVCRFFLGFIAKVSVKMSLSDILMVLQKRCLIPVQSSTFGDDIRGENLVCVRLVCDSFLTSGSTQLITGNLVL